MFAFLLTLLLPATLNAQVLVEEGGRAATAYRAKDAESQLRDTRKVAVGFGVAGAYGGAGSHLELNFTPEAGFLIGFGLGDGFQAFNLQVKRVLAGDRILPYIAGGLARWYSVGERKKRHSTQPAFLAERFLNRRERRSGEFSEILVYPAVGLQFVQLDGDWAGFSVYAELQLLLDIDDFVSAPTGGLGLSYYF